MNACGANAVSASVNKIANHVIENPAQALAELQFRQDIGVAIFDFAPDALKEWQMLADHLDRDDSRFDTVVEVCGVVCNLVGNIDELRLEGRTLIEQILRKFGKLLRVPIAGVLDDPFANWEGQVKTQKLGIAQFEMFHDAQGVQVVVEDVA